MNCNQCGSDENTRMFRYFGDAETGNEERLCWDCREPMVRARANQGGTKPIDDEPAESGQKVTGQSGITDFI